MRRSRNNGFTLVELLVVIGIIALLISILLPALSSARRSANAVKCSASLRELGNSFKFYAIDNKNWYPPALMNPQAVQYEIDGVKYPVTLINGTTKYGAYWYNFLARYITKTVTGAGATNLIEASDARRSVIWGCPAFDGYAPVSTIGSVFAVNPVMNGYCMNVYPTFNTDNPAYGTAYPPPRELTWSSNWTGAPGVVSDTANGNGNGGFTKANVWGRRGSERMLLADGRIWLGQTGMVAVTRTTIPTQLYNDTNNSMGTNETTISLWRHAKAPQKTASGYYDPNKSKVSFNMLYCDGHVATNNDARQAYLGARLRFPG